jgi:hypothetical protein
VYGLVETVAAKQNEIDDLAAWQRRVVHEIERVPDAAWLGRLKQAAGL